VAKLRASRLASKPHGQQRRIALENADKLRKAKVREEARAEDLGNKIARAQVELQEIGSRLASIKTDLAAAESKVETLLLPEAAEYSAARASLGTVLALPSELVTGNPIWAQRAATLALWQHEAAAITNPGEGGKPGAFGPPSGLEGDILLGTQTANSGDWVVEEAGSWDMDRILADLGGVTGNSDLGSGLSSDQLVQAQAVFVGAIQRQRSDRVQPYPPPRRG
jgi:hypothetical protein